MCINGRIGNTGKRNMLNYIWSGMLFLGIIWGAFHGRLAQVTEGALNAAGEAVTLSITMLGIVVFWNGILEIGSRAGLVEQLSEKMRPALKFLFPDLPSDCEAARQICVNFIANILGLGWAATPAGLKAMKELEKVEEERRKEKVAKRTIHAVSKGTARA
jgi:spore maturation protein A